MGGDRRRTTSHSIEVPLPLTTQHNSRKRPPSYTQDSFSDQLEKMDECNAALILMNLSNSPSPKTAEKWLGSSPGSSSASWSSGSSSPPLSDDGHALNTSVMLNDASARIRTTSVSTSDEGIVVDFKEVTPRKKKASKSRFKCTWKGCKFIEHTPSKIERHIRSVHLGNKKARRSTEFDDSCSENDHEEEFYYTEIEDEDDEGKTPSPTSPPTLSHRDMARPPHEDPEYQRQIVGNFKQGRVSQQHQLQQHHNSKSIYHGGSYVTTNPQQQQPQHVQSNCIPTSPLAHHNYTWPSSTAAVAPPATGVTVTPTTPPQTHSVQQPQQYSPASLRHARTSPRPSQSAAPYPSPTYGHQQQQQQQQHHNYSSPHASVNNNTSSNNIHNANIIHSNNNANNMLQQLSQQNVTVTAHHSGTGSGGGNANLSHQQHQIPAVTITPNYHPHHQTQQQQVPPQPQPQPQPQHIRSHHQTPHSTTANNMVAIQQHGHAAPTHIHQQHAQHITVQHTVAATTKPTPNSPNRRTRGENKKCRKVYGMERREQWCTQCRWKKACTRFGD